MANNPVITWNNEQSSWSWDEIFRFLSAIPALSWKTTRPEHFDQYAQSFRQNVWSKLADLELAVEGGTPSDSFTLDGHRFPALRKLALKGLALNAAFQLSAPFVGLRELKLRSCPQVPTMTLDHFAMFLGSAASLEHLHLDAYLLMPVATSEQAVAIDLPNLKSLFLRDKAQKTYEFLRRLRRLPGDTVITNLYNPPYPESDDNWQPFADMAYSIHGCLRRDGLDSVSAGITGNSLWVSLTASGDTSRKLHLQVELRENTFAGNDGCARLEHLASNATAVSHLLTSHDVSSLEFVSREGADLDDVAEANWIEAFDRFPFILSLTIKDSWTTLAAERILGALKHPVASQLGHIVFHVEAWEPYALNRTAAPVLRARKARNMKPLDSVEVHKAKHPGVLDDYRSIHDLVREKNGQSFRIMSA